jgi:hypothetical protein
MGGRRGKAAREVDRDNGEGGHTASNRDVEDEELDDEEDGGDDDDLIGSDPEEDEEDYDEDEDDYNGGSRIKRAATRRSDRRASTSAPKPPPVARRATTASIATRQSARSTRSNRASLAADDEDSAGDSDDEKTGWRARDDVATRRVATRGQGRSSNLDDETASAGKMKKLISLIEREDIHDYFKEPVTDEIAPGYSDIVPHPMDLSTIRWRETAIEHTAQWLTQLR